MSDASETKNVSRNLMYVFIALIVIFVILVILFFRLAGGQESYEQQQIARAEDEKAARIAAQGAPSAQDAQKILDQQAREAAQVGSTVRPPSDKRAVPPPSDKLPAGMDPVMTGDLGPFNLPDIERRARQREGRYFKGGGDGTSRPSEMPQPASAPPAMSMPEVYDVGRARPVAQRLVEDATGSPPEKAQGDRSGGKGSIQKRDEQEPAYDAVRPRMPPDTRLLNEGTIIDAVLINDVNTQNPGPVQFRVVSDVYDSLGERQLLIPKGSKLIGSYGANTNRVGLDRVPISIRRIILTDGRSIELRGTQVTDEMGSVGAGAEHHSNILRAVGPSALVALLGYWVDKSLGVTQVPSGNQQPTAAQSISQQVVPKIEERIAGRYGAAQPYYTIDAGQRVNIVLSQDVVIPAPR